MSNGPRDSPPENVKEAKQPEKQKPRLPAAAGVRATIGWLGIYTASRTSPKYSA